jgi:hypothetical protein
LTVDAVRLLPGSSRGGFFVGFRGRFRGHFELSFCEFRGPQDAVAVVRWEIVRFVVNRLAPADFGSVASLAPFATTPILDRWTLLNERRLSGT